eukprot:8087443-Pyramimonas_sp.AAC.1
MRMHMGGAGQHREGARRQLSPASECKTGRAHFITSYRGRPQLHSYLSSPLTRRSFRHLAMAGASTAAA